MSTSFKAICNRCGYSNQDESHSPIRLEELHDFIWNHSCVSNERGRSFEIIDEYNPRFGRFCDKGYEHKEQS